MTRRLAGPPDQRRCAAPSYNASTHCRASATFRPAAQRRGDITSGDSEYTPHRPGPCRYRRWDSRASSPAACWLHRSACGPMTVPWLARSHQFLFIISKFIKSDRYTREYSVTWFAVLAACNNLRISLQVHI